MKQVNGPWKVDLEVKNRYCADTGALSYVDKRCWIKDSNGEHICLMFDAQVDSAASLVAAAPSMFEALDLILRDNRLMNALNKEQARAVMYSIAKAKGEVE